MPALIFDCDGVLADTERYGHLPAFNRMFAEFGLPIHWSEDEYARRLLIGGGKERLASLLTDEFVLAAGLPTDPEQQRKHVAEWHRRKTELYVCAVEAGMLPPRPGVARIAAAAHAAGWHLAVASTSAESSVRAVLRHAVGDDLYDQFHVFAGDIVPQKKPSPAIYLHAIRDLGVSPADALVVEDSRNGLLAAVGAGLKCVITISSYSSSEAFHEAAMVVTDLGDPGGTPIRVLENRSSAEPAVYVTFADLRVVLYGS